MGFISPLIYLYNESSCISWKPASEWELEQMVRRVFGVLESNGIKTEMIRVGGKPRTGVSPV